MSRRLRQILFLLFAAVSGEKMQVVKVFYTVPFSLDFSLWREYDGEIMGPVYNRAATSPFFKVVFYGTVNFAVIGSVKNL